MLQQNDNCVFCRICNGKEQSEILYKDDEYVVFPDIKPAAKHHYLIVTREHIQNAKQLTTEHRHVVEKLIEIAKQVLTEEGADLSDVRFGFHWPPFNSIQHLHLHAISPASSLGFVSRLIFRPNSWWFVSPEYVTSRL
ncbi:histidine triad nucleotide-binding protein 3-like isoform X1 [Zootermopsis nevadensis]|uniref:Adenosine 5'-monophosphoramidase HINT3 n=1 Tax=Zootermopsis nevadensis TaxID=136037 RepID=A0A067R9E6_ZOONE|nr:histidine triad nucleotide-binding protein 3-like isoform X1 [Zootermopsis nevadensis]KDR20307.1 Histidine triad nucleotide-binding protein 3 [Zootermopsis nevadensis]